MQTENEIRPRPGGPGPLGPAVCNQWAGPQGASEKGRLGVSRQRKKNFPRSGDTPPRRPQPLGGHGGRGLVNTPRERAAPWRLAGAATGQPRRRQRRVTTDSLTRGPSRNLSPTQQRGAGAGRRKSLSKQPPSENIALSPPPGIMRP